MGGFVYEVDYKLTFDDPKMAGFECTMREPSVNEMLDVVELLFGGGKLDTRERTRLRTDKMASHIIEWNLTDKAGLPCPISTDSILAQGRGFSVQLTAAWLREVVGLTIPPTRPSEPSNDSPDSALAGLPMDSSEPEPLD